MTDKYIKVKIYNLDAGAHAWGNQTTSTPTGSTSKPTRPTGKKRPGGRGGQNIISQAPPVQVNNYYKVTENLESESESIKKDEYIFIMRAGENYQLIRMVNDNGTIKIVKMVVSSNFLTELKPKLNLVPKQILNNDYEYITTATLNVGTTIIEKGTRLKINDIKRQKRGPVLYDILVLNELDKDSLSTDTPLQNIPLDNFSFYLTSSAPVHKQSGTMIKYAIGNSYLYCGNLIKFKIYDNIKSLPCIITLTQQTEETNTEGKKKPIFDLTIKYVRQADSSIMSVKLSQLNMMPIRTFVTELNPKLKETVTALFQ